MMCGGGSGGDSMNDSRSLTNLLQRAIHLIDPPSSSSSSLSKEEVNVNNHSMITISRNNDDDTNVANEEKITKVVNDDDDDGRSLPPLLDTWFDNDVIPPFSSCMKKTAGEVGLGARWRAANKHVRFDCSSSSSSSSDTKSKTKENNDAIVTLDTVHEAYTLLLHAVLPKQQQQQQQQLQANDTTIETATAEVDEEDIIHAALTNTWEMLNTTTDIYRVLLISACLLLEMLPTTTTTTTSTTTATTTTAIMTISPPLTKIEILITCRSCIRKLRHLERVCAIKTISIHHRQQSLSIPSSNSRRMTSFHDSEGGDDIHDYDRSYSDLISNYDWHDDGFLLPPSSICSSSSNNYFHSPTCDDDNVNKNCIDTEEECSSSSKPSSFLVSTNNSSNILYDCLYKPKYTSDPPSSKYERNAYTRDWVRGERVISLKIEDYYDYEYSNDYGDKNNHDGNDEYDNHVFGDYEHHCVEEIGQIDNMMNYDEVDTSETSSETINDNNNNEEEEEEEEDNVSLFICPKILAQDEAVLLNIMLHNDDTNYYSGLYHNPSLNRARSIKERKKKKRKRQLKARKSKARLVADASTIASNTTLDGTPTANNPATNTRVQAKEGYLLLLPDDYDNNNSSSGRSVRVYVRLHPSGWIIVEDRSIRNSQTSYDDENELHQQQLQSISRTVVKSLPRRLRYRHYYIDPATTTCTPCIQNGETIFHFQLNYVLFLGNGPASAVSSIAYSSSLIQQQTLHDIDRNNDIDDKKTHLDDGFNVMTNNSAIIKRTSLIFKIDEGMSGDFMDGYEWVNCITSHCNNTHC